MNILIANDTCEADGGASNMALADAQALAERGHRVIFFSACGTPPEHMPQIEWISLEQRNILEEPRRWLAVTRGLWNWTAAVELRRVLARFSPADTVVHLHSWSKALSGSVVAAADRDGFPVIATLHDYFVACPNGSLYDYPARRICGLRPMSPTCVARHCDSRSYLHKLWRVLRQGIWRHLAGIPSRFTRVIAVSEFSAKKLRPLLAHTSLDVLSNPVPNVVRPSSADSRAGIAYAGRLSTEKGVDLYLEACARAGVRGEVWGDGPLLPTLKRRWPDAEYRGWLQREELNARLSKLLVLVVPSYLYETYGLAAAEAMAAGVAVIVADRNAATDLIEDEATGLQFQSGNVDDLAAKIRMLMNDPGRARDMGRRAAERFWRDHAAATGDRWARLEVIYHQALAAVR